MLAPRICSEKTVEDDGWCTLLLRCDAGVAIGTGHAMRCLALAQACQDAGRHPVFAMALVTPAVAERLLSERMMVVSVESQPGSHEDATCLAELASQRAAGWVVVDGYHFDADYQRALRAAGLQILLIDDEGRADHYAADLILNQNAHADASLYPNREPSTRLLLGSRYVLIRREFERWREWKREIPVLGRRILVTMGGSDPDNLTARAIEALMQTKVEGLEAIAVVGGSNPHLDSLQRLAAECGKSVRLLKDPSNMPDLMAWADLALIAAGGTLWELLAMGCPVLSYARNPVQARIISQLSDDGIVGALGYPQDCSQTETAASVVELANSQERRTRFSRLARERIDGYGAQRVFELLAARRVGQL
jgi:UDP-2,4-diacetamido-2,4,6-trideoxy-beta-L-altropyranose hydrolase